MNTFPPSDFCFPVLLDCGKKCFMKNNISVLSKKVNYLGSEILWKTICTAFPPALLKM